ncbi:MAG TPA: ribonuclease Z [Gemmatimonadales bacterium]|nr:ribonuclease Z [Gemmatimonadales bacterium]
MLSITFLGTSASIPTIDRNVAGLAVQREGETILFDCGEGSQRQMMRYGVGFSFREIFFTHYHADHLLGVTGLLRTMGLQDRTAPVVLYGPKGAQRVLGTAITLGVERNKFPVEILEIKPGDRLARDEYDIVVFATEHRADTVGFALVEHPRLGRFNPDRARELGIPEGPLWGQLHRGKPVTLPDGRTLGPGDLVGSPRPGRSLVYTGDTRPHLSVIEASRNADLLVHEATFGGDELERARETGHSTAAEAARVALEAGVRRLVLTHISSRYNRDASELLAEAKAVFPETVIARDGMTVDVPYADAP